MHLYVVANLYGLDKIQTQYEQMKIAVVCLSCERSIYAIER